MLVLVTSRDVRVIKRDALWRYGEMWRTKWHQSYI